ncbi:MAG: hypothetical protein KatS3mg105_0519 [Gemmatales bacterium]|nr:MAG: hypothetical protein KatS3mg105_0519 [Gemmatales bacterium]
MRNIVLAGVVGVLLGCGNTETSAEDAKKGPVVKLGSLSSQAPGDWKEEPPANRMRLMQFVLPKAEGDKKDAELVIFRGIGGSTQANIERWKKQFIPPTGKKLDDVAKVSEMKVGDAKVTYLDISGTYLFKPRPFVPDSQAVRMPEYRMLAVVFLTKDDVYHIRLVGPEKTVKKHKDNFDKWLKSFR